MVSLAKTIIYGTKADVEAMLKTTAEVNVIDEYGYTPLIECAIVNSVEKAILLINKGANSNYKDLTGRSPLHWAADNNNLSLCKLFLENHADPNSYSAAGEPVLVMPLLRQQKETVDLLSEYGAQISFAEDFTNAKLLGHRFELIGHVDILDPKETLVEIDYEGFYLEFTVSLVARSLDDFIKHFSAGEFRDNFEHAKTIITSLQRASELIRYHHYGVNLQAHAKNIQELLNIEPQIIPIGYEGHAVSFVISKDYLAYCDRGEYGRKHGTVTVYRITKINSLTFDFLKSLLYGRNSRDFIQNTIQNMLGLEKLGTLPIPPQKIGNCSWANVEAVIPALLFIKLMQNDVDVISAQKKALRFFYAWREWDKHCVLHYFINSLQNEPKERQATKAAILGAVLFQQLNYQHIKDIDEARKIIPVLIKNDFGYILKSYIKYFYKHNKTEIGKNLAEFLDDFGVDSDSL